jgi:hypothetical protein
MNDVSVLLGDSINRLRREELDNKVANAMGYLARALIRALEQGRIEERLAKLDAKEQLEAITWWTEPDKRQVPNRFFKSDLVSGRQKHF